VLKRGGGPAMGRNHAKPTLDRKRNQFAIATLERSNRVRQERALKSSMRLFEEVDNDMRAQSRQPVLSQVGSHPHSRFTLHNLPQHHHQSILISAKRITIYQFEQLKEKIISLWSDLKFSHIDREMLSLFFYSIRYAPILEDHHRNLLRFKDRTLDVLKLIQVRESKLERLTALVERAYRSDTLQDGQFLPPFTDSREMRLHVAALVGELRAASLEIVDAIHRWRTECLTHPKPYIWNATNYLLKIESDFTFFLRSPLAAFIPDLCLSAKMIDAQRDSREMDSGDYKDSNSSSAAADMSKVQIISRSYPSLPPLEWIQLEAKRRDKILELQPVIAHLRQARDMILNEHKISEDMIQRHSRENQEKNFAPSLASELNPIVLRELKKFEERGQGAAKGEESEQDEEENEEIEDNSYDEDEGEHNSLIDIDSTLDALDREVSKINSSVELDSFAGAESRDDEMSTATHHISRLQSFEDSYHNGTLNLSNHLTQDDDVAGSDTASRHSSTPFGNFFSSRPASSLGFGRSPSARSSNGRVQQRVPRPKSSFTFQMPPSHDEAVRLIEDAIEAKREYNRRRSEKMNRERLSAASVSQAFKLLMGKNGSSNRILPL